MGIYVYQDEVTSPKQKLSNLDFDWTDKSVLELGCNVGKLGNYVLKQGAREYKGIELDKEMVKIGIERYGLDLIAMDVSKWNDFDYDVTIAMALFHHFDNEKLENLLSVINSKVLIFEVPVGTNDTGLYQLRTKQGYTEMVRKLYGDVVEVVDSGATNDPYNPRMIFHCKK